MDYADGNRIALEFGEDGCQGSAGKIWRSRMGVAPRRPTAGNGCLCGSIGRVNQEPGDNRHSMLPLARGLEQPGNRIAGCGGGDAVMLHEILGSTGPASFCEI